MEIKIRQEQKKDFRAVEEMTREAFWNLHGLGCDEHFLVHKLRGSEDYLPELSFIAEVEGEIVGAIFYVKSWVIDKQNNKHDTITFGPLCVHPKFQRLGVGRKLVEHTSAIAKELGYPAIIIFGYPTNYCRYGFRGSKAYGITSADGSYPFAMLVLELTEGALDGISGVFHESPVFQIDANEAAEYDKQFPFKEKRETYTQEEFLIASNSFVKP